MTLPRFVVMGLCLTASLTAANAAPPSDAPQAGASQRTEPTKAQTEEWLREHIEAWKEADIHVTVKDCRIMVLDRDAQRTEIVDLRGLLLPVEVIRVGGSSDATLRLRVKEKHTGNFSMFRRCDAANRFCAEPTGKFQSSHWVDLTVTSVTDFRNSPNSLNVTKVTRLERALEHYSRLCGATEDARNLLF